MEAWRDTGNMRIPLAAAALTLGLISGAVSAQTTTPKPASPAHRLSRDQAQRIVRLVARHDHIDLGDTHVEVNSLDLMSPFIPGYASFILIREATSPGPDETLARYAVNRSTGDVWEMTQCTRYDFPALRRVQRSFTRRTPAPAEIAAEQQELGCSPSKPATANPAL